MNAKNKVREMVARAILPLGSCRHRGFTLVELLVSMGILSLLLLLLVQLLDSVQTSWNYSEGRVSQFREARVAFDIISKNLGQATLNTYWDLEIDPVTNDPKAYIRQSELHFLVEDAARLGKVGDGESQGHAIFFQAPLGFSNQYRNLSTLLNGRGYYLIHGSDKAFKPGFVDSEERFRFRLMEYRPPAEENLVYVDGYDERINNMEPNYSEWFKNRLEKYSSPLAENIVALVVSPREASESSSDSEDDLVRKIAPEYKFDSSRHSNRLYRNQLPPLVRLTVVAIDEASAIRFPGEKNFVPTGLFKRAGNFESDIKELREELGRRGVNFKVFSTIVPIRSAKWSIIEP